jgi:hypothetical protein
MKEEDKYSEEFVKESEDVDEYPQPDFMQDDSEPKYTKEQFEELIPEHERMIKIFSSVEDEDMKQEVERQKQDLEGYKKQLKELTKEE